MSVKDSLSSKSARVVCAWPIFFVNGIFYLNIFRLHLEFLPPVIATFWLDGLFIILTTVMCLTNVANRSNVKISWIIMVSGSTILSFIPLFAGDFSEKWTFAARLFYFLFFLPILFWPWVSSGKDFLNEYSRALVKSSFLVAVVVFFQLWSFSPFTDLVHLLWGVEKLRSIESMSPRVYGTFYNSNWFGVYSLFVGVAASYLWKTRRLRAFTSIVVLLISFAFLFVSGSRTALLGGLVAMGSFFLVHLRRGEVLVTLKLFSWLFVSTSFLFVSIMLFINDKLLRRWNELFNGDGVKSADGRFVTWSESLDKIVQSPFFGNGAHGIAHNSYLTTFEVFGIFIGSIIIGLYLLLVFSVWVRARDDSAFLLFPILMAFSVMSVTAEFFYTTQLMILLVPLLMVAYRDLNLSWKVKTLCAQPHKSL